MSEPEEPVDEETPLEVEKSEDEIETPEDEEDYSEPDNPLSY